MVVVMAMAGNLTVMRSHMRIEAGTREIVSHCPSLATAREPFPVSPDLLR
jgi:hypothetical protein